MAGSSTKEEEWARMQTVDSCIRSESTAMEINTKEGDGWMSGVERRTEDCTINLHFVDIIKSSSGHRPPPALQETACIHWPA